MCKMKRADIGDRTPDVILKKSSYLPTVLGFVGDIGTATNYTNLLNEPSLYIKPPFFPLSYIHLNSIHKTPSPLQWKTKNKK
ncbi:hypothetical protein RIF29_24111 [Crotalaria pallida]|uniref:Uncharacterized protein n=1 Tax=Crotalaria pallida TaxID=3830 RepID=A0AAN9EJX2_CROPI